MGILLGYYHFLFTAYNWVVEYYSGTKNLLFSMVSLFGDQRHSPKFRMLFKEPSKFSVNFTLSKDSKSALTMHSNLFVENLDFYLWYVYSFLEELKETYRSFGEMADFINYWGITTIISWFLSSSYSIYSRAANLLLFFRAFVFSADISVWLVLITL